jgi:GH15 family glucan-1,4-alpha-glucosidase
MRRVPAAGGSESAPGRGEEAHLRDAARLTDVNIEDYGMIGDTQTAALVGRNGSIDWLCLPHFNSPACFASLVGKEEQGCWQLAPAEEIATTTRRYREGTLVLETEFTTAGGGCVRIVDFMPPRQVDPDVVRLVEGVRGRVKMRMKLLIRFDYGSVVPWVRRVDDHIEAVAGPDALSLWSPVETHGENMTTVAEFEVNEGDRFPFVLLWHASCEPPKKRIDPLKELEKTVSWWHEWSERGDCNVPWSEPARRSLITLKALTFAPTGGVVAAPTTSLPEFIGGVRNWDYRCCWLRDATFTLYALLDAGYTDEACAWRDWLVRAVAGDPSKIQIMYGLSGERRLDEYELPWLPGYEGSRPVRVGNAAVLQFQLDVYGEVIDAMYKVRMVGMEPEPHAWKIERAMLTFLEEAWTRPDEGIWEVRGPRRHFTHSKVMAWVAFDRAVKTVEKFGFDGEVARWREKRDRIHDEVCSRGFSREKQSFVQEYDQERLDASLLMLPLVGFLPAKDARMVGTVRAIERELMVDGFVLRYNTEKSVHVDALPKGEGCFLLCTFWLADNYALAGRYDEARAVYEQLLAVRNDLGLLSEEYDPRARRMLGNFPQAFSHVGLVNTARNLSQQGGPAHDRRDNCKKDKSTRQE